MSQGRWRIKFEGSLRSYFSVGEELFEDDFFLFLLINTLSPRCVLFFHMDVVSSYISYVTFVAKLLDRESSQNSWNPYISLDVIEAAGININILIKL